MRLSTLAWFKQYTLSSVGFTLKIKQEVLEENVLEVLCSLNKYWRWKRKFLRVWAVPLLLVTRNFSSALLSDSSLRGICLSARPTTCCKLPEEYFSELCEMLQICNCWRWKLVLSCWRWSAHSCGICVPHFKTIPWFVWEWRPERCAVALEVITQDHNSSNLWLSVWLYQFCACNSHKENFLREPVSY